MLDIADASRLASIVLDRLGSSVSEAPGPDEYEPGFTARVLMPQVRGTLQDINISDLTLTGDGAASAPIIALPSCEFRPDIALLYRRDRFVAFEVKILRSSGRQYSLAAAIGQALIYRSHGYQAVGVILVDISPIRGEAAKIAAMLSDLSLLFCVFNRSGSKLASVVSS